jgi:hypothetical protein
VKYYRHFRFFDYGRVLYSLDIIEPRDMKRYLQSGQAVHRRIYEGSYTLSRNQVSIQVQLHYCQMLFELLLLDGDDGYAGKHNMLTLLSHSSVPNTAPQLVVSYPIPVFANFRFYRVWNFQAHHG